MSSSVRLSPYDGVSASAHQERGYAARVETEAVPTTYRRHTIDDAPDRLAVTLAVGVDAEERAEGRHGEGFVWMWASWRRVCDVIAVNRYLPFGKVSRNESDCGRGRDQNGTMVPGFRRSGDDEARPSHDSNSNSIFLSSTTPTITTSSAQSAHRPWRWKMFYPQYSSSESCGL